MSILSEAWRRAHGGDARLSKTLGAPAVTLRQRPPLLPWLLCGLLVALVAGLCVYIWLVQTRPPPPKPALAATVAPDSGKMQGVSKSPATAHFSAGPKPVQPARPRASPAGKRQTVAAKSGATAPAAAGIPGQTIRRNVPVQGGRTDDQVSPPRPAIRQAAAAPLPSPSPSPSRPIALNEAPAAIRTAFPSFDIVVHVWNANPAERFVMIGVRQFHEGDEIAPGVRLLKITRGGEIVRFRGYRLLLP